MRDLYKKTVYGVGYIGEGIHKVTDGSKRTNMSNAWKNMLQRCYRSTDSQASYKDVIVCDSWHCFQNFGDWYIDNYVEGWHLEKDILVKGNKTYSPENCCFVPPEINYLFIKNDAKRGRYPIGISLVCNRFQVTIRKNSEPINLGRFRTIEEAFKVYKIAKEGWIKEVADKWKPYINPNVYEAMYNWVVEVTD